MACALDDIASMLEAELAQGTPLNAAIQSLLAKLFAEHMPIVFDGNGYSDEWLAEAEKRGLPNLKDTVAALAHYSDKDVMAVFERHGVLSPREMLSRQEILLENYTHSVSIEGHTALKLGRTRILPVALAYQTRLAKAASSAAALVDDAGGGEGVFCTGYASRCAALCPLWIPLKPPSTAISAARRWHAPPTPVTQCSRP